MGLDRHTSDGIEDDERPAWTLAVALLPAWATHLFVVGDRVVPALAVLAAAPVLCVVFDVAITLPAGLRKRWAPRPRALLLGLLLPFWLPPLPPPWALTLGALLAVGFDRLRLPGIGPLPLQPLLLARVVLVVFAPDRLGAGPGLDAVSGATPLGLWTINEFLAMAGDISSHRRYLGINNATLASTLGLPWLFGGLLLVALRGIPWRVPVAMLGGTAFLATVAWAVGLPWALGPAYHLLRGDLVMAAFFLATDPRLQPRSPQTGWQVGLLAAGCMMAARACGLFPLSVPLGILAANVATPWIDRLVSHRTAPARDLGRDRRHRLVALAALTVALVGILVSKEALFRMLDPAREAAKKRAVEKIAAISQQEPSITWVDSVAAGVRFMRAEVTVAQYIRCVRSGHCSPDFEIASQQPNCNVGRPGRLDHPINCINQMAAEEFCAARGGRLPTYAEWMAEASQHGTRRYPWGNEPPTCVRAVVDEPGFAAPGCGAGGTAPVCSRPAGNSDSGLCDMVGNVWEWSSTPGRRGTYLVLGGGWNVGLARRLTASSSLPLGADFRGFGSVGFRCVRDAVDVAAKAQ